MLLPVVLPVPCVLVLVLLILPAPPPLTGNFSFPSTMPSLGSVKFGIKSGLIVVLIGGGALGVVPFADLPVGGFGMSFNVDSGAPLRSLG